MKQDKDLRNLMYKKYLHWCSSMEFGFGSLIIHVNIAHLDIKTNRFYRNVVEG